MVILVSVLSKEAADTLNKKKGSTTRLPTVLSNYNEEAKCPMLSAGAEVIKYSPLVLYIGT